MHVLWVALFGAFESMAVMSANQAITVAQAEASVAEDRGRSMRYVSGTPEDVVRWQEQLRAEFARLMKLDDLMRDRSSMPLESQVVNETDKGAYVLREVTLRSTPGRIIPAVVAMPKDQGRPMAAVVGIHGHGGTRMSVFDPTSGKNDHIYKAFGHELAARGCVVISADVGQHEVYEEGRTLMGERLWDLMRCVDYLQSLPEVDGSRIGCAGLSLGGEMAMWLGAMDTRIAATVSAGFLTTMDQMEQNHCMCWKFDGLRALADWPDVYGLIAPRALQCQNGLKEPDTDFHVPLARQALREIQPAYADLGVPGHLELDVHEGGHEIDLAALMAFLNAHLKLGL